MKHCKWIPYVALGATLFLGCGASGSAGCRADAVSTASSPPTSSSPSSRSDTSSAPSGAVFVSIGSIENEDPYAVINSNIGFVNALLGDGVPREEIAPDALRSYYVDYWLAQVRNGGFSQFVFNTRCEDSTYALVREGLVAMQAARYIEAFDAQLALLNNLGAEARASLCADSYYGDADGWDQLGTLDSAFFALNDEVDLITVNATWLRNLPNLEVRSLEELYAEHYRRIVARVARLEAAGDDSAPIPRWFTLSRALVAAAGLELDAVQADMIRERWRDQPVESWLIRAGGERYRAFESGGSAWLLPEGTTTVRCRIDATGSQLGTTCLAD